MTPEELKRRMRFHHPDEGVSVRNRQYRWKNPTYEIKNIRTNREDPNSSTVYYEDTGGNKYKTNAQTFVERFGDFYIENSLKHSINLLAQVPGYDSPELAVENINPASVERSCPNCGCMAMKLEMGAGPDGQDKLKCPRCGFSINNAPDERFLMTEKRMSKHPWADNFYNRIDERVREDLKKAADNVRKSYKGNKMSKLNDAINKLGQFSPTEQVNFFEMGIPRDIVAQLLSQMPLQGTYRITEDSVMFDNPEDANNIKTYLMTAKKEAQLENIPEDEKVAAAYEIAIKQVFGPVFGDEISDEVIEKSVSVGDAYGWSEGALATISLEHGLPSGVDFPESDPNITDLWAEVDLIASDILNFRVYTSIVNPAIMAVHRTGKKEAQGHPLGMGTLNFDDLTDEEWDAFEKGHEERVRGNPTLNKVRELEEEMGMEPMEFETLDQFGETWEDYLDYLEEQFVGPNAPPETYFGQFGKKAQVLENLKNETKDYDAEILDGMARCLFVNAWADYAEENLDASFSQMELMDVAPETPPESFEKAKELYNKIEDMNNVDLGNFVPPGIDPDEGFNKELFGHYLCMEALGHGVSWKDDHEDHGLQLPRIEAYADMDFSEATLRQMYEDFDKDFPEGDYIFESEPVYNKGNKKEASYGHSFTPKFADEWDEKQTYNHSFAPAVYGDVYSAEKKEKPTNVADALASMNPDKWNEMAKEVFNVEGDMLDLATVMAKIIETNIVGSLFSPVDFWIDEEGYYTVDVYDEKWISYF